MLHHVIQYYDLIGSLSNVLKIFLQLYMKDPKDCTAINKLFWLLQCRKSFTSYAFQHLNISSKL